MKWEIQDNGCDSKHSGQFSDKRNVIIVKIIHGFYLPNNPKITALRIENDDRLYLMYVIVNK